MNAIENPQVFVCVGYEQIYDDFKEVNPNDFLKNVPTVRALEFIVERQNKVIYSFSNLEEQKNFFYEMRCYIKKEEQCRVDSFLLRHDYPYFMDNQSCFLFYMLALQNNNKINRELTIEDIQNIYKAYLYCSQIWTNNQLVISEKMSSLDEVAIRIDLPIVEFKMYKDFRPQLYKASRFFAFCNQHQLFKTFAEWFYKKHNVSNCVDYISRLFCFYESTFQNKYIHIPAEYSTQIPFFDQFAINIEDCEEIWDRKNFNFLRNHFLYKIDIDTYLVLNINLLVDKLYQGLIFDFWNVVKENGGQNLKGEVIKGFDDFKSILGEEFSEPELLYDVMNKSFTSDIIKIEGRIMKTNGIIGEPDYYARVGNSIFIFEYKDYILSDKVKMSKDYSEIKTAILDKICKDNGKIKKGGGKLLYNIDRIVNHNILDKLDDFLKDEVIIYPILVINDKSFSAMGINYVFTQEFINLAQTKYAHLKANIALPIIIELDTLFSLMTRLHTGILKFENIVKSYLEVYKQPQTAMMPFSTFVYDYYPLEKYTKEEIDYMFDKMLQLIKEYD